MPVQLHETEEAETTSRVEVPAATVETAPPRQTVDHLPTFRHTGKRMHRALRLTRRGAVAVLLLCGALGGRWWQVNQQPVLADLSPRGAIEPEVRGPNAAHFYAAAMDALREPQLDPLGSDLSAAPASVQQAEAARNVEALSLLRQGAGHAFYGWQGGKSRRPFADTLGERSTNFIQLRELARMASGASRGRAAAGQRAAAMEMSADIMALGRHAGQGAGSLTETTVLDGMIGLLVERIGLYAAEANARNLTADEARVALRRLEELPIRVPLEWSLRGEYRQSVSRLEALLRSAGDGEMGRLAFPEAAYPIYRRPATVNGLLDRYLLLRYGRQGMVDGLVGTYREQIRRAALPLQEAQKLAPVTATAPLLSEGDLPATVERARRSHAMADTLLARLQARLAIQVYRAEHAGRAPGSLDSLVGQGYLSRVPADAFSVYGDAPLRYDPESGKVWSVGSDGVDNGGAGDDVLP